MFVPVRTSSHVTMVVASAIAVVLALAGCSTTETSGTTETSSTPSSAISDDATSSATGGSASTDSSAATSTRDTSTSTAAKGTPTTLRADDKAFTVDAPAGWKDAIDTAPAETVLAAQSTTRTGDSFNTLVVTKGDSIADLDEVVAASIETLKDGDTDVEAARDITIDGQKAYGFSTTAASGDDTITNRLRYVNFNGSLYTVTFSTSQVEGEISELADQELNDILDSWTWSSQD